MIKLTDFKYGQIYVNDKDFYIGKCLLEYGEYCEEEAIIFNEILNTTDNVIEVGSNIGALSIPIAQAVPKGTLHAIEPQKVIYDMMVDSFKINNISNVKTYQLAIGDKIGDAYLPELDYERENNFGGISIIDNGVKVKQTTLDSLISLHSLKLIKIDVEGMEAEVLNGAKSLISIHRPFIYCENDRLENTDKIFDFLTSMNYRIYTHNSFLFHVNNFKENNYNVFKKNIIALNILAVPNERKENFNLKQIIR